MHRFSSGSCCEVMPSSLVASVADQCSSVLNLRQGIPGHYSFHLKKWSLTKVLYLQMRKRMRKLTLNHSWVSLVQHNEAESFSTLGTYVIKASSWCWCHTVLVQTHGPCECVEWNSMNKGKAHRLSSAFPPIAAY